MKWPLIYGILRLICCQILVFNTVLYSFSSLAGEPKKPQPQSHLPACVALFDDKKYLNGILAKSNSGAFVLATTAPIYPHSEIYKALISKPDLDAILWVGELEIIPNLNNSQYPFRILAANETASLVEKYLSSLNAPNNPKETSSFPLPLDISRVTNLKAVIEKTGLSTPATKYFEFSRENKDNLHLDRVHGGSTSKIRHDFINEIVSFSQSVLYISVKLRRSEPLNTREVQDVRKALDELSFFGVRIATLDLDNIILKDIRSRLEHLIAAGSKNTSAVESNHIDVEAWTRLYDMAYNFGQHVSDILSHPVIRFTEIH